MRLKWKASCHVCDQNAARSVSQSCSARAAWETSSLTGEIPADFAPEKRREHPNGWRLSCAGKEPEHLYERRGGVDDADEAVDASGDDKRSRDRAWQLLKRWSAVDIMQGVSVVVGRYTQELCLGA